MGTQATVQAQQKSSPISTLQGGILQRKCECGQHTMAGGECESCRKKHTAPAGMASATLQRAAIDSMPRQPGAVPPIVGNVLKAPGHPLDTGTRSLMESRFGHDFSQVRVHTDPQAAESASAVHARAYTVGQDVVFGAGQYAPETAAGQHLLAHELTHTIQQQHGLQRHPDQVGIGESTQSEHEAETAATAAISGQRVAVPHQTATTSVQRTAWGACQGERVDGTNVNYSKSAELYMIEHYQREREKSVVALSPGMTARGNFAPLEDLKVSGREAEMIKAMRAEFRSNRGPSAIRRTETVNPDDFPDRPGESAFERGRRATTVEPENELERPDIPDITMYEVYDVTTLRQAGRKVGIIAGYVRRLESIRQENNIDPSGKPWVAGRTLKPPPPEKLNYQLPSGEVLCFGWTDFDTWPGVLIYEVLKSTGKTPSTTGTVPYTFVARGITVTLQIPPDTPLDFALSDPVNQDAALSVPALRFLRLRRTKHGDSIEAQIIDFSRSAGSAGEKLARSIPLRIADKHNTLTFDVRRDKNGNAQLFLRGQGRIPASIVALSEGYLIPNYDKEQGFSAKGIITPSIPLLKNAKVDIAILNGEFSGRASISKDFGTPLPGFHVKEGSIGIELAPDLKASGDLIFEVGPKSRPILDGSLKASADTSGFVAEGQVFAHLPGVDKADGNLKYQQKTWTGGIEIKTTQIKIPGLESSTLRLTLSDKGLTPSGEVTIKLGQQKATLGVVKHGNDWIYSGKGKFDVPGLKTVDLDIMYDGKQLSGDADTGFEFKGLLGHIHVKYRDGRVTGSGRLDVKRGRATGFITVNMSDAYKFSGKGQVDYQFSENLIGILGIELPENGDVRVVGGVKFPKPIRLFKGFEDKREVFKYSLDIPIPGLGISLGPLGTIGLAAIISTALNVHYGIGPGELTNVSVLTAFNPLAEQTNFELAADATLTIPARAGVSLTINGDLGIKVGDFARASGGIGVTGTADLVGGFNNTIHVVYAQSKLVVDSEAEIKAALKLLLGIDAHIGAEAGIAGIKYEAKKVWQLASYGFDTGLEFGLKAPIHYASDEPFHFPSFSDITWTPLQIDAKAVLPRLVSQAKGEDR